MAFEAFLARERGARRGWKGRGVAYVASLALHVGPVALAMAFAGGVATTPNSRLGGRSGGVAVRLSERLVWPPPAAAGGALAVDREAAKDDTAGGKRESPPPRKARAPKRRRPPAGSAEPVGGSVLALAGAPTGQLVAPAAAPPEPPASSPAPAPAEAPPEARDVDGAAAPSSADTAEVPTAAAPSGVTAAPPGPARASGGGPASAPGGDVGAAGRPSAAAHHLPAFDPPLVPASVAQGLRIYETYPRLPPSLSRAGARYSVLVEICVAADGNVSDVHVKQAAAPELDRAVVQAARTWRYGPFRFGGRPVPFCHPMRVTYARE